jgi:hypothetical protein
MKAMTLLLLVALAGPAGAQEPETLLGDNVEHGGYGGPVIRLSGINGQFGIFVGGHGGWIIDHRFVIGGGGYGLVGNTLDVPYVSPFGGRSYLTFGYGGLEVQYIGQPVKLVHFTVFTLVGAGGANYRAGGTTMLDSDPLFVAEPGAGVEVNLTRTIRLSAGATYRLVRGVTLPGLTNGDLSGPSGFIGLGFGHF